MSETTIFEKILNKELPADIVYEDSSVLAFKDIYPQAPIHILFIHKSKTKDATELGAEYPNQASDIFKAISKYVIDNNLEEFGYRIVSNAGAGGGQTVFYTHFHLLSGGQLGSFGV